MTTDKGEAPDEAQKPAQPRRTCLYCGGRIGLARALAGATTCQPCDDLPATDPDHPDFNYFEMQRRRWQKGVF